MELVIFIAVLHAQVNFSGVEIQLEQSVDVPKVGVNITSNSVLYSSDLDDDFDPTLPTTPPPKEVNIIGKWFEEDFNKGLKANLSLEFDIQDVSDIPYLNLVIKNAREQNFDAELTLAVIKKESSFNPRVVSHRGAVGLMQLLPETAKWLGLKDVSKLKDPNINIKYGIKYLRYLFSRFAEDLDYCNLEKEHANDIRLLKVLAAYNAGPGNVVKYNKPPYNGIPPFYETQDYVEKVSFYFIKFKEMNITH